LILGALPEEEVNRLSSVLLLGTDVWYQEDLSLSIEAIKISVGAKLKEKDYAGAIIGFDSRKGVPALDASRRLVKVLKGVFTRERIVVVGTGYVGRAEDGLFPVSFFAAYEEETTEFIRPFCSHEHPRFFTWDKK
jgi:hypothetical protein